MANSRFTSLTMKEPQISRYSRGSTVECKFELTWTDMDSAQADKVFEQLKHAFDTLRAIVSTNTNTDGSMKR